MLQLASSNPAETTDTAGATQSTKHNEEDIIHNLSTESDTAPDAQPEYDNIENILNEKNSTQIPAYQELFKAWNRNYNHKIIAPACKQAETFSLRCLHRQGNLNSLKAYNRPAVLTLVNDQGEMRYITITSIKNDLATVYSNNTAYTIKLSELDQYWYGQFILLWRKPDNYSSAITPGDSGNIVAWLNNHFVDNQLISSSKAYDDILIEKVKAFQAQQGLAADGIVGPITIIHLNTKAGMNVPTLTTQS